MLWQQKAGIVSNRYTGGEIWIMEYEAPDIVAAALPGQFVQLRVSAQHDLLLRRPLSIYDLNTARGTMRLLYKVVGRGTAMLAELKPGDELDVLGPLGQGFTLDGPGSRVALVGGGVGIAPLLYLAKSLLARGKRVNLYAGAQNAAGLAFDTELNLPDGVYYPCTDDGSKGYPGRVVELFQRQESRESCDAVYSCGPEPMMAAVAAHCRQQGLWAEFSLETHMACGLGACLGCAYRLREQDQGYAKICQEGPVFPLERLDLGREGVKVR